jgi:hypothetical protein
VSEELMSRMWFMLLSELFHELRESGLSPILLADGTVVVDEGFGNYEESARNEEVLVNGNDTEETSDEDDWHLGVRAPDDIYITPEASEDESHETPQASSSQNQDHESSMQHQVREIRRHIFVYMNPRS